MIINLQIKPTQNNDQILSRSNSFMLILIVLNAHTICKEGLTFSKGITRAMNHLKRMEPT
jgi:hypothetical protein